MKPWIRIPTPPITYELWKLQQKASPLYLENEYLINDSKSRLKEIGNLFLDTGIGKTAYSVIGQGKVERIINSSPKEIKYVHSKTCLWISMTV